MSSELKRLKTLKANAVVRGSNSKTIKDLTSELGQRFLDENKLEEAIQEFQEFKEVCQERNERLEVAFAHRKLGEIYVLLNDFKEALRHQNEYLTIAQGQNNDVEIQRAFSTLGGTYLSLVQNEVESSEGFRSENIFKHLSKAEDFFQKAYDAVKVILDPGCSDTERDAMKCVILTNRVKLYDFLENESKSEAAFIKAEKLMKTNKFSDRLQMLYELKAGLEHKKGKLESALDLIDKSLRILNALGIKKSSQTFDCLILKAHILLDSRLFHKSKSILLKAYRLNYRGDKSQIKDYLKKNVFILKLLEKEDANSAESLEKIGDITVGLGAFNAALWYYNCSLEKAIESKDSLKLSGLYTSLAATYKDLKKFDKAMEYYLKESELSKDKPEEAYKTTMALAITADLCSKPYEVVVALYEESTDYAIKCSNIQRRIRSLIELSKYQKDKGKISDYEITKEKYSKLMKENFMKEEDEAYITDDDDDEEHDNLVEVECDKIDVDDLTDSDDIEPEGKKRKRGRIILKKDLKGETELHRKVKKEGNISLVKRLINQGVDVNIGDNAEYTPLHEACNHGQIVYVKTLIEDGKAAVNRQSDNGTTPLLSAAVNGYTDIIEYLLDNGAKAHSQDQEGWTALDYLEDIYKKNNNDLDSQELNKLQKTIKRLNRAIELKIATGFRLEPKNKDPSSVHFVVVNKEEDVSISSSSLRPKKRTLQELNGVDDFDESRGPSQYASAIHNLKNNFGNHKRSIISSSSSSLFSRNIVTNKEYERMTADNMDDDDWLEDDLGLKKRKSSEPRPNVEKNNKKLKKIIENDDVNEDCIVVSPVVSPEKKVTLPVLTPVSSSILRVKVQVLDKLFLIPLMSPSLKTEWLIKETSKRYYSATGMDPILSLSTPDGAELHPEDLLSAVLGTDNDKLTGNISSYNFHLLQDRYVRICKELKKPIYQNIYQELSKTESSNVLNLSLSLTPIRAEPILKALKCQSSLTILKLPRNRLGRAGLETLAYSLPTLVSLRELDLSLNSIDGVSLDLISNINLSSLISLNLSFNYIGDSSNIWKLIKNFPSLTDLNLSSCELTNLSFKSKLPESSFKNLKDVNFSHNSIGELGIEKLLDSLDPLVLRSLDVSGCSEDSVRFPFFFSLWVSPGNPNVELRSLNLSDCNLRSLPSLDVFDRLGRLEYLNISSNPQLSLETIISFLETVYLKNVPLKKCEIKNIDFKSSRPEDIRKLSEAIDKFSGPGIEPCDFQFSTTGLTEELSKLELKGLSNKCFNSGIIFTLS